MSFTEAREEGKIFADLAALCTSPGYIHALAALCFRDNVIRYSEEIKAEDLHPLFKESRLIRTEESTLIGLVVKDDIDLALPSPEVLQGYIDKSDALLKELHESMSMVAFRGLAPADIAKPGFDPFDSGEAMREPIFYGGESAYIFQYRDFAELKYARDNEWLKRKKGFSIEEAKAIVKAASQVQNEKISATLQSFKNKPPHEWTVLPGLTLTAEELAKASRIDLATVSRVLDAFTLPPANRNDAFNSLNDFNVVNAFPLLRFKDDYVLFHPYSLAEALYDSPFYWMAADKGYADTAMQHRGDYTEDFSRVRLELVFGKNAVHPNVEIKNPKGEKLGEIDVLVLFGNRAVVLQAKSKRLTLEARRGNDGQIRDDFKKSIQDSYDQAFKCAELLLNGNNALTDESGQELKPPDALKQIFLLCVVADHYPALAFQTRQFLKTQTTEIIQPPFVLDVFTLDAMTEMLQSPLRLLSYVSQRTKYTDQLLAAHELTILSFHLKQNLWLSGEYSMVHLGEDISADLDLAMMVRRDGIPGKATPDGILTRFGSTELGGIVQQIEAKPDPGTIDLGFMLLTLGEDTFRAVSKGIGTIARQARKDGKSHDITVGVSAGDTGLTIHCNSDPVETAAARLRDHCHRRKYTEKARTWFGLCLRPDQSLRFGLNLDFPWERDAELEARTQSMKKPEPVKALLADKFPKRKVGRNDPCPCGSGKKYKKCCLPR